MAPWLFNPTASPSLNNKQHLNHQNLYHEQKCSSKACKASFTTTVKVLGEQNTQTNK